MVKVPLSQPAVLFQLLLSRIGCNMQKAF